nr:helicase-related protein [Sanguibacter hominis]
MAEQGRAATAQEQETLAQWSSWGAVPEVFESWREDWTEDQARVKAALTQAEYGAAMTTTLNAHYTDPSVVAEVWRALGDAGFTGGPVLEPGCGSGTFIGLAPESAQMVGVELDPLTAQIAGALYPKAQVRAEGFERTRLEGQFNAVVGNVPFGSFTLYDPLDNPRGLSIHNHFIVKSLRATAPGGYVAVLTSRFTMDAQRPTARREMARYGDLVGAVRLPTGAFQKVAGTEVVTDVLVFRRREDDRQPNFDAMPWLETYDVGGDVDETAPVTVNKYWQTHPEKVLGEVSLGQGMHGDQTLRITGPKGDELVAQLRTALAGIIREGHEAGLTYAPKPTAVAPSALTAPGLRWPVPEDQQVRAGHVREARAGTFEAWNGTVWEPVKVPRTQVAETRSLLALRDAALSVVEAQRSGASDEKRDELRAELGREYDRYAATFGAINRFEWSKPKAVPAAKIEQYVTTQKKAWRAALPADLDPWEREDAVPPQELVESWRSEAAEAGQRTRRQPHLAPLRQDPEFALVLALELFDEETQQARKSHIFSADIVGHTVERERAETPADALAISMDEKRQVDVERIAELLGTDVDDARARLRGLVYTNPVTNELEPAVTYVAGNVREKLEVAQEASRADARFEQNVLALEAVIPETISLAEVTVRPGVRYITKEDYEQFIRETFRATATVLYTASDGKWAVDGPARARLDADVDFEFGVAKRSPFDLLEAVMNNSPVTITKSVIDAHGRERTVRDVQATTLAREKCEQIAARFTTWLHGDPERVARVEAEYNGRFNSFVAPDYSQLGAKLALDGMSPSFKPHDYQRTAVARILNEPSVLLDHVVGAGKTGTMIMGAMELRRTGIARKPWLVVPNHLVEQIAAEWKAWYPSASVLAIPTGCTRDERREWIARSAASDWDGVIVPASVFKLMTIDPYRSAEWLAEDIATLRADLAMLQDRAGKKTDKRVKKVEKQIKTIEARYAKAFDNKDAGLTFESSGCDYLFVDEAHNYKNLMRTSAHQELACTGSLQALDLDHKLRALREAKLEAAERAGYATEHYLPAVATFATGTPVANSLAEMWVMQHYLRPDVLTNAGVDTIDAWAGQFTQSTSRLELGPDGSTWRMKDRISRFANVPELLALTSQFASVVTTNDITVARPDLIGGQRRLISRPASAPVVEFVKELAHRANNLPNDPSVDNLLKITHEGRTVALDPRLMGLPADVDGGRIADVATEVMRIDAQHATHRFTDAFGNVDPLPGGLQIIFADRGVPKDDGSFSVYEAVRDEFVNRGMERSKIRFIHEATDDDQRAALFEACRDGRVSVLIGSTEKMGTGVNVQKRATALHHMDCPYRPSDLEQREGRIIRQGNQVAEVEILNYVTEGTYDAVMWQMVARKAAFIAQVKTGQITGRVVEDLQDDMTISAAAASAVATGDPRIIERAELIHQINGLETLESAFRAEKGAQYRAARMAEAEINVIAQRREKLNELIARTRDTSGDQFSIQMFATTYTSRADAGAAVLTRVRKGWREFEAGSVEPLRGLMVGGVELHIKPALTGKRVIVSLADLPERTTLVSIDAQDTESVFVGLTRRLENLVAGLPTMAEEDARREAEVRGRIEQMAKMGDRAFPRQAELDDLRSRLLALDAELDLTEKEQEGSDPDARISGEVLARTVDGLKVRGDSVRMGDIVTNVGRAGMWEVKEPGMKAGLIKADAGDDAPKHTLEWGKAVQLVSRRVDQLTDLERAAAFGSPDDRLVFRFGEIGRGAEVTVEGWVQPRNAQGPDYEVVRSQKPTSFTGKVTYVVRSQLLDLEDANGDVQRIWTSRTDDGSTPALIHGGNAAKHRVKPVTVLNLLPGDVLTEPVTNEKNETLPTGSVRLGSGAWAVMLDPTSDTMYRGNAFTEQPVQYQAGRDLTADEMTALFGNEELTTNDLRRGDVVMRDDLDSRSALSEPVVILIAGGYGARHEVEYRVVGESQGEKHIATRSADKAITLVSRRFGALTDFEVRSLRDPEAQLVDVTQVDLGTPSVAVTGQEGFAYGAPRQTRAGALVRVDEVNSGLQVTVRTAKGREMLVLADREVLVYPEGHPMPAQVDRSGIQQSSTTAPAAAPAGPRARPRPEVQGALVSHMAGVSGPSM